MSALRALLSPLLAAVHVTDVRRATRITSTVVLVAGLIVVGITGKKTGAVDEIGTLAFLGGLGGVVIPWIGQMVAGFQIRRQARALLRAQRDPAIDTQALSRYMSQVESNTYRLEQYDRAWSRLGHQVDEPRRSASGQLPWPDFDVIDGGQADDLSAGLPVSRRVAALRGRERRGRS